MTQNEDKGPTSKAGVKTKMEYPANPKDAFIKSPIDEFLEAAAKLSDADRGKLQDRGYVMPSQDDGDTAENWGYLCSGCGAVAIFFQGSKFRNHDGTFTENLPPGMALNKLPWIQKQTPTFPRSLMSCETPICPDCHVPLSFEGGSEKYLKTRLIRSLVAHRQVEAENRRQIEDHRNSRRRVPIGNPSPNQIRIPT